MNKAQTPTQGQLEHAAGSQSQFCYHSRVRREIFQPRQLYMAIAVITAAAALRSIGVSSRWLWLDELWSANLSGHGFFSTLINVLRFDVHPPLYYLQLSFWAALGRSELWLMGNTILWSTAAAAAMIYTASRIYDFRTGLYAGLMLAVAPAALAYSDDVRMYSFLLFLIIWVWYFQERWLRKDAGRFGWLWMVFSQAAVAHSHTAGLVMLSGCVLYGASRVLASKERRQIISWLGIEFVVGVLSLPVIAIGTMRDVLHTRTPDLPEILSTWAFLLTGVTRPGLVIGVVTIGLTAGLLALAVYQKALRIPLLTLVLMPLFLAAFVSYAIKPIWLDRIFLTTIPFVCLITALGLTAHTSGQPRRWRNGVVAAIAAAIVFWAGIGTFEQFTREKGDGFKPSAVLVRDMAKGGDTVLLDGSSTYWFFMWYYAGPDWGEPRHAFIMNADWQRMMARLPASVIPWLGFNQSAAMFRDGETNFALWDRTKPLPDTKGDLIVVRPRVSPDPMLADRKRVDSQRVDQLLVERWTAI